MHALKTIAVAFSMFSAVPMPQFAWDEDALRHMLVAFPLVGLLVGALMWCCASLCILWSLPHHIAGLLLTALPLLVTGGIHLDGFSDTWDALGSRREPERMRQILKDPHVGTFGVMHLVLLLLASFVLWTELASTWGSAGAPQATTTELGPLPPISLALPFVLSRSFSGLSVATFPLAPGDGLARSFASSADRKAVRLGCAAIAIASSAAMVACGSWAMIAAAAAVFAWYRIVVVRRFGGLSGDLCGWFVQTSELWMLAALWLTQTVG